jgi:hypothetical protein
MRRYPLVACAALFLLPFPARTDEGKAKPVTVPFELLKTRHIAVMVKINGKGPYRLIFDTGAPVTLLNTKIGREAGLMKQIPKSTIPLFGTAGPVKVNKMELGDLTVEKVNAVVMDHPTVEAISKALGPIDGLVGLPFFGRFKTTIDYQAKEMTFLPNGYDPPDAMEAMMATVMGLMMRDKPAPRVLTASASWGMVVAKDDGDEEAGVTIKKVLPGGPAAAAGLKAGDRLLTLDGRWTDSVADCYAAAARVKPGTAAEVQIQRSGKDEKRTVTPTSGL